jgi:hypothetical protein
VTYDKKTVHTHPYLAAYVQFSRGECKQTAKAERRVRSVLTDYTGTVTNSPFERWDGWQAGTAKGIRHVCAYLYATKSAAKPILTASATYRDG